MPSVGVPEIVFIVAIIALLILVPVAVILLAASIWSRIRPPAPTGTAGDPAILALRTRLAKGEIDQVEFERLRSTLQRR